MNVFSELLNGYAVPATLLFCGLFLAFRIRLFRVLSPKGFLKDLKSAASVGGVSPVTSLCTALAGTLGVGNIAGVATAVAAGGPGAILWMIVGSVFAMSVKYGEVVLAVKYRRNSGNGYFGGSMYSIRDGLSKITGNKIASAAGAIFAVLCVVNSLIMGNLLQSNSASAVADNAVLSPAITAVMAVGVAAVAFGGNERIGKVTTALIPILSGAFAVLSLFVISKNLGEIPSLLSDIIGSAFTKGAVVGGIAGHGMKNAVRYGVTRGIFSNEAGCGTSPTAHAAANVDSPHKQGCFGIFEVIVDTPLLCSMTALVVLIGMKKAGVDPSEGVRAALLSFRSLAGGPTYYIAGAAVILFAYATVIAQLYYGKIALSYLIRSRIAVRIYGVVMVALTAVSFAVPTDKLWVAADLTVGTMTVLNTAALIILSGTIKEEADKGLKGRKKKDRPRGS